MSAYESLHRINVSVYDIACLDMATFNRGYLPAKNGGELLNTCRRAKRALNKSRLRLEDLYGVSHRSNRYV